MEISEAWRPKELETENSRLKKLVANQALDIQILKEVNAKNGKPQAEESDRGDGRLHGVCNRQRACRTLRLSRSDGLLPPFGLAAEAGSKRGCWKRSHAGGPALATRRWRLSCATNTER